MAFITEGNNENVINLYMKDLKKAPSEQEEKDYIEKIKNGDLEAKEEFIERNLRLVVSIAKRYQNQGLDFGDLIQEGNIGLIKALENFNPELGNKFSTYATFWITQGITRSLNNDADEIRKPVHIKETIKKMYKKEVELRHLLNREPTLEEVAKEIDLPLEKAEMIMKYRTKMTSLDSLITPAKDDERESNKSKVKDFVEDETTRPDKELEDKELSQLINKFLKKAGLTEREKRVLLLRNGFKDNKIATLEEIGLQEGVTRERIRQIEKKALDKLRNSKYKYLFTDYINTLDKKHLPKEKKI